MSTYFHTVTNGNSFQREFKKAGSPSFHDLTRDLPSASNWGLHELLAFHVLTKKSDTRIMQLVPHDPKITHVGQIEDFLCGPPQGYQFMSEKEIIQNVGHSLGHIWAALARTVAKSWDISADGRPGDDLPLTPKPKRIRTAVTYPDMIRGSSWIVNSSSPLGPPSSQPGPEDDMYIPSSDDNQAMEPETDTERLLSSVSRHLLLHQPASLNFPDAVVEFRDAHDMYRTSIPAQSGLLLRGRDDGGLCIRRSNGNRGYLFPRTVRDRCIAIIETKRRLDSIHEGKPLMSDNWFAQMVCEALAVRVCMKEESPSYEVDTTQ